MSTRELQERMVENMKQWQKIENASVSQMAAIMEKTDNPLISLIMEIIQRDSQMHHRVQQMVVDSLESQTVRITPEELGEVWGQIEDHQKMEKETIKLMEDSLEALKGRQMVVQEYLLNYLKHDEEKHDVMLESLAKIKRGMYPYG
ncbi:MAG: hypothetical protein R6X25_06590 [Candidatus Krumholzibacteriia bacterium]